MNRNILSKEDINLLLAGFPDLKQKEDFPSSPRPELVTKYISDCMRTVGVEGRPSEMLEYLAVVISMKMAAQASLGQPDNEARRTLDRQKTPTAEGAAAGLDKIARGGEESIMSVHENLRRSIASMDFKTAAVMYPVQSFLHRNLEERISEVNFDDDKEAEKIVSIPLLGGNETGVRDLEPGEFSKTAGYRIVPILQNGLFNSFAGMHLMTNSLQVRAMLELSERFPKLRRQIAADNGFFAARAAETLAVCHAAEEGGLAVGGMETLKKMITAPETKTFAYSSYVPLHKVYSKGTDVKNARCPFVYGERWSSDTICRPRCLADVRGGSEFMAAMQKQSGSNFIFQGRQRA